jgi:hypothetical protein
MCVQWHFAQRDKDRWLEMAFQKKKKKSIHFTDIDTYRDGETLVVFPESTAFLGSGAGGEALER